NGRCSTHAQRLPRQASLAQEVARAEHGHDGFFPRRGHDRELYAAILDVEHAGRLCSLSEHDRATGEAHDATRHASRVKERVYIERRRRRSGEYLLSWHEAYYSRLCSRLTGAESAAAASIARTPTVSTRGCG